MILARDQLHEIQQQVATMLPHQKLPWRRDQEGFAYRNLASIVSLADTERFRLADASSLYEQGKTLFRRKKFAAANKKFKALIENYPTSVHVVKAHFLLAEGQFRLQHNDKFLSTVDEMIDQFPENDLTGFAMLRLGELYEYNDRVDDARDLYSLILKNYSNHDLRSQAAKLKRAVE